jgi:hypothetical protein
MRDVSNERLFATKVLINFADGLVTLCIPRGATLADVSEKVGKIGRWHKGRALSVEVRFGAGFERQGRRAPILMSSSILQLAAAGHQQTARHLALATGQ